MRKISLVNGASIPESLSNICFMGITTGEELKYKLLETKNKDEFLDTICELTKLNWKFLTENDDFIQLVYKDDLGNTKYLKGFKEKSKISPEKIKQAENMLIKYGVNRLDASDVLESIGYILLDTDIYNEE